MTTTVQIVPYHEEFPELGDLRPHIYPNADRNPALAYLNTLDSEASRNTMRLALETVTAIIAKDMGITELPIEAVPWHKLRAEHMVVIRAALQAPAAPDKPARKASTVNKIMVALRQTLRKARALRLISMEDCEFAIDELKKVKQTTIKGAEGRALSFKEIAAIIDACDDGTRRGARDVAIFAVGYGCGLRRSEIVNLQLSDYYRGALHIRRGKGNKERIVPVPPEVMDAIDDWLEHRGREDGPLFRQIKKPDRITDQGLTPYAVQYILTYRADLAGVNPPQDPNKPRDIITPHDLRRTFAGDMLDQGVDIATVQLLMGHSDPKTTAGYDRRGMYAREAAMRKMRVPYKKKGPRP